MALTDKVLVRVLNRYEEYPALMLNETHAIFFTDNNITCCRVFPTSLSSFLHVEDAENSFYFAMNVKVVNEEEQLKNVKEQILKMSLLDYITKIYKETSEPNLNLIEVGDYKVKEG